MFGVVWNFDSQASRRSLRRFSISSFKRVRSSRSCSTSIRTRCISRNFIWRRELPKFGAVIVTKKLAINRPAANVKMNGTTLLNTPRQHIKITSENLLRMNTPVDWIRFQTLDVELFRNPNHNSFVRRLKVKSVQFKIFFAMFVFVQQRTLRSLRVCVKKDVVSRKAAKDAKRSKTALRILFDLSFYLTIMLHA